MNGRVNRETRESWSWVLHDYASFDIWIELFRRGESKPIHRLQRTLNIFVDRKQVPQYQHSGVKHVESIVLPEGKYLMRVAAREPNTDRLAKLSQVIEVDERGVKSYPQDSDPEEKGSSDLLLDRPAGSSGGSNAPRPE